MTSAQAAYFFSLPVSPTSKAILFQLSSFLFAGKVAKPGQKWLAAKLGRHRRTVIRAVQELERAHVIRKVRRGKGLTNLYFLAKRVWSRLAGGKRLRDFRHVPRAGPDPYGPPSTPRHIGELIPPCFRRPGQGSPDQGAHQ